MPVKIFVLGRPGSGKTTAANHMITLVSLNEFSVARINDFDILLQKAQTDTEHSKFLFTENGGFDVIDFSVMDDALLEVEKQVNILNHSEDLITIEFARDNYEKAFKVFNDEFLKDSYFLFFDVSLDICLERIRNRVANPVSSGDHPSRSEDKFREYYGEDGKQYITTKFKTDYSFEDEQIVIIQNEGTKEEFMWKLEQYFTDIILNVIQDNHSNN